MGLGLHVLGDRDGGRTGFDRVGEHPHRAQQGRGQLFGPPHPVEVARQRLERVVDGHFAVVWLFEFLQHRGAGPGGEGVGGQQQHGQPVDGGQRGAGEHVRRSRSDTGRYRPGLQPVLLPGIANGGVHHGLLVAAQHIAQRRLGTGLHRLDFGLQQGLAQAGHVAVAEDAEATGEELAAFTVALDVLVGQEPDGGLGHRESHRRLGVRGLRGRLRRGGNHFHAPLAQFSGNRGSTAWSDEVSRSQACSGSSTIQRAEDCTIDDGRLDAKVPKWFAALGSRWLALHRYTATGKCMWPVCSSGTSSSGQRVVTTLPRV